MAFSGGVFSLVKNWVWYRAPHPKILSDMLAAEFAGIATALSAPHAGAYNTSSGNTGAITSGVATTIGAVTSGLWLVHAYLPNGDATNYSAMALIGSANGADARIQLNNNGNLLTITLSGLNIQVTQGSGASNTVTWSITKFN